MSAADEELRKIRETPPPVFREQFPLLGSGAVLFLLSAYSGSFASELASHGDALLRLYAAGFAWSAIQMLATLVISSLLIATDHGFIKALRGTRTLASVRSSNLKILVVSLILMTAAVPLIVAGVVPSEEPGFWYAFVAIWFSLLVGSALAFFRVIRIFITIATVKEPREHHGA